MRLWQKGLSLTGALACLGLVACEQSPHAASAIDSNPTKARDHVIGCFKDAYQAKQGTSPVVNNNERSAAEQLLSRYNGTSSRACEAINEAIGHNVCGLPMSLVSIVQCDQRQREAKAGQGVDPNTKAQITDRIKENSRKDMSPNGMSGN
ncbi:MAG TPA: hypothetical protein VFQ61_32150 [Polyangiaceae bacterium]|nr:hypothetical protein [Polyangiaceae bacterium]